MAFFKVQDVKTDNEETPSQVASPASPASTDSPRSSHSPSQKKSVRRVAAPSLRIPENHEVVSNTRQQSPGAADLVPVSCKARIYAIASLASSD